MRTIKSVRTLRSDGGSALVELTVSLPVLIAILIVAGDFGRVFYHSHELTVAARASTQYAAVSTANSVDSDNIRNTAIAAAPNLSPVLSTGDITLGDNALTGNSTAEVPQCAATDGSTWANPTSSQPWTCSTSTCPGGQPVKVCYVKVTVTKSFAMISGYLPAIPNPLTVSRTAWQRVQ